MRFDAQDSVLKIDAAVGIKNDVIKNAAVKPGERIAGWVFERQQPLFLSDTVDLNTYVNFEPRRNLGCSISIPLKTRNRAFGVLNVSRYKDREPFRPADQAFLNACADIGTLGIERTGLTAALREKDALLSRSEDELRLAAKVSHVGYAACAMVHDIHNPLGIIAGYTALAWDKTNNPLLRQYLQGINQQIDRIKTLTQSLQERLQCESQPVEAVSVRTCIDDSILLVRKQLLSGGIEPDVRVAPDLPPVNGRRYQLERLFVNIFRNAIQAMEHAPTKGLFIEAEPAARGVAVHVRDTGPGVPEHDRERIFDPFYSTNGNRSSLGLGLSICRDIVNQHQGTIQVHNHAQGGAVFTVVLPYYATKEQPAA
jgi:signal transduction histidine kinase